MLRRYELTDQEWEQIAPLLPPEKAGKPGRPAKENRQMLNAMVWIAHSGAPWRDLPERYGLWKSDTAGVEPAQISMQQKILMAIPSALCSVKDSVMTLIMRFQSWNKSIDLVILTKLV